MSDEMAAEVIGEVDSAEDIRQIREERTSRIRKRVFDGEMIANEARKAYAILNAAPVEVVDKTFYDAVKAAFKIKLKRRNENRRYTQGIQKGT